MRSDYLVIPFISDIQWHWTAGAKRRRRRPRRGLSHLTEKHFRSAFAGAAFAASVTISSRARGGWRCSQKRDIGAARCGGPPGGAQRRLAVSGQAGAAQAAAASWRLGPGPSRSSARRGADPVVRDGRLLLRVFLERQCHCGRCDVWRGSPLSSPNKQTNKPGIGEAEVGQVMGPITIISRLLLRPDGQTDVVFIYALSK